MLIKYKVNRAQTLGSMRAFVAKFKKVVKPDIIQ